MKNLFTKSAILFSLLIFLAFATEGNAQSTSIPAILRADTLYFNGQWEGARKMYEAGLTTTGVRILPVTWFRLGYCYQNLGNIEEALKDYKKALSLNPAPALKPNLYSRMARVYAIKKQNEQALVWLDSAAKTGYLNINEVDTLKEFNSIRKDKRFDAIAKKIKATAFPCSVNPKYREFDFWIGEWNVYQTGTKSPQVGHSLVQNVAGECLILENWTALGPVPNTGKSMNYYDARTDKWEQIWMGSGPGLQKYIDGKYSEGAMKFIVDPTYLAPGPDGKKPIGRFSFTNQGVNQVRQLQEQSVDDGKTWQVVYDLTYVRKNR